MGGIDALREAFASGNYAIRQRFVYEDLAFVQQVNGGDECRTLKLAGDGDKVGDWVDFESWSFGPVLRQRKGDPAGQFTNFIRSMQMATPEQCEKFAYAMDKKSPVWGFLLPSMGNRSIESSWVAWQHEL